jgi:hypothetical protein
MSLQISTFDNKSNTGDPLFKALGHPAMATRVRDWIASAAKMGRLAVVDPWGQFSSLAALYDISLLDIEGRYVQRIEDLLPEHRLPGAAAPKSLLELETCKADTVLLAAFDGDHARRAITPLLREGTKIISFDDLKLDGKFITNARRYLDPLNFATNFALFRAGEGRHSIVRTANYWSGYGAVEPRLLMILFGGDGDVLAEWEESLTPGQSIVLDAEEVRARFSLPPFSGMLLIHAVGVAGHAEVKYVLDDVDDDRRDPALTHDSNSWPAQYYCGLPAPRANESVRLWLQNSHPGAIPAGALTIGVMGHNETVAIDHEIPGFGTFCLKIEDLFPGKTWPLQFVGQSRRAAALRGRDQDDDERADRHLRAYERRTGRSASRSCDHPGSPDAGQGLSAARADPAVEGVAQSGAADACGACAKHFADGDQGL